MELINITDFEEQKWKKYQGRLYSTLRGLLEDGIKQKEFPQLDSGLMFKAIGGLFTGMICLGAFLLYLRLSGPAQHETEGKLFIIGPAFMMAWVAGFVVRGLII